MARKKKDEQATADEPTFEQDLARLEEIVAELEDGDLPLERALALFEEGTKLGQRCGSRLEDAERKITVLLERADGALEERDFEPDAAPVEPAPAAAPRRARAPRVPTAPADGGLFDDADGDEPDGIPF